MVDRCQVCVPGTACCAPTTDKRTSRQDAGATRATRRIGDRREVLRLRPAPRTHRAKKKARDSAQDDRATTAKAEIALVHGGLDCGGGVGG